MLAAIVRALLVWHRATIQLKGRHRKQGGERAGHHGERPDPVVAEDYYQRGIDINKTLEHPEKSLAPAMKGRNHAATPPEAQPR